MAVSPDSGSVRLVTRHLEALKAARASLAENPGAAASIRRIAGVLCRAAAKQAMTDVAAAARRVEEGTPDTVEADADRLIGLLSAIATGVVTPPATVLIIDDDPDVIRLLSFAVQRSGRQVVTATAAAAVLEVMKERVVDAVLLDLGLPDLDGREILAAFRNQPYTARLPIVIMTASADEWVEAECLALGASSFLAKPLDLDQVVMVLDQLIGRPGVPPAPAKTAPTEPRADLPIQPIEVLLAEHDPLTAQIIRQRLQREGLSVRHFASGSAALEAAGGLTPGVVLLDALMPGVEGIELVTKLRAIPAYRSIPIIVLSSIGSEREVVRALEAGADDCLRKPFSPTELVARIDRLLKRREE